MTSPAVAYFSKDPRSFWSIFCWIFPAGLFPPFQTAVEHWMQDIGSGEDGEMNPVSKYEERIEACCSMLFSTIPPGCDVLESRDHATVRHSSLAAHKETHFWLQVRNAGLAPCEPWTQLFFLGTVALI